MGGLLEPGSFEAGRVTEAFQEAAWEQARPSVVYGADLIEGMTGDGLEAWAAAKGTLLTYGPTPAEAMRRFDQAWRGATCHGYLGTREPRLGESVTPGHTKVNSYCSLDARHSGACRDEEQA